MRIQQNIYALNNTLVSNNANAYNTMTNLSLGMTVNRAGSEFEITNSQPSPTKDIVLKAATSNLPVNNNEPALTNNEFKAVKNYVTSDSVLNYSASTLPANDLKLALTNNELKAVKNYVTSDSVLNYSASTLPANDLELALTKNEESADYSIREFDGSLEVNNELSLIGTKEIFDSEYLYI